MERPVAMNDAEIAAVVDALSARLVGRRAVQFWQPSRDRMVIGFDDDTLLLLVPRGPHARLHSVDRRPRQPRTPFSFQGACRAWLKRPLTGIDKAEGDRIVDLHFGAAALHLRLTGGRGGLWLVSEGMVVASLDGPAPEDLPELPEPSSRPTSPRFEVHEGEDADQAARRFFDQRERQARLRDRRADVERRVKRQLARDRRLLRALHGDLDKAARADEVRGWADALAANLHRIERGASEVLLDDLSEPGRVLTVPLDPRKKPAENMERLYHRARRLDRMGERVLDHLDKVERRITSLDAALHVLDDADHATLRELERIAPKVGKRGAPAPADRPPWDTWRGPEGHTLLVGRNAAGNRKLCFQIGRGHWTWLHARERPGAHVLIRLDKGKSAPLDVLLAAAQLALRGAGVPDGEAADVQYTALRNIRSIPGDTSGRVLVHDERVLHVERDDGDLVGWTRDDQEAPLDVEGLERITTTRGSAAR